MYACPRPAATVKLTPTARNLLATVVVVGLLIATVGAAVFSAYTSVASNDGNTFTAGTIKLTDNDAGSALFNVQGFTPGDSFIRCIQVDYASTGGVRSNVKLYGRTGGSGLAPYVDLRIRRGTMAAGNPSGDCTGFTPDTTDYDGNGDGVFVDTTLDQFPTDYTGGITDPVASWASGDKVAYEITMTIQNDNAAQGLSATQDFSFEARNL
ncbi:MAG: TasA family protein [Solirubrobacteraceae bacterium]|nr:TasA family protein [Patulibacter sp.]